MPNKSNGNDLGGSRFHHNFTRYFLSLFGNSLTSRFSNFLLTALFGSFVIGTSAIIVLYEKDLAAQAKAEIIRKSKSILSKQLETYQKSDSSESESLVETSLVGNDGQGGFYFLVDRKDSNLYFPQDLSKSIVTKVRKHFSKAPVDATAHEGHVLSAMTNSGESKKFEFCSGGTSEIGVVYYGRDVTYESKRISDLLAASLLIWLGAAVVLKLLTDVVSRELTRPIQRLCAMADVVDVDNLDDLMITTSEDDSIEVHQTAYAFNGLADRLRISVNQQKSFASVVAHELRTPLSLLNGYVTRLRRDYASFSDRAKKSTDKLKDEIELMIRLVDSLLEISRIDAQIHPPLIVDVPLNHLLSDVAKECRAAFGREVVVNAQDEILSIETDYSKLKHVLLNLCENAVKYSSDDTDIELNLYLSDGVNVCVSVVDHGTGIKSDELPYIFDRFYRCSSAKASGVTGSGLGLSIVRALVESLGATIQASSTFGVGSEFVISWGQH